MFRYVIPEEPLKLLAELCKIFIFLQTLNDSDSESSESEHDLLRSKLEQNKHIAAFLRQAQGLQQQQHQQPGMTSFESMAAQIAAVASLGGLQQGLAPFYPGTASIFFENQFF